MSVRSGASLWILGGTMPRFSIGMPGTNQTRTCSTRKILPSQQRGHDSSSRIFPCGGGPRVCFSEAFGKVHGSTSLNRSAFRSHVSPWADGCAEASHDFPSTKRDHDVDTPMGLRRGSFPCPGKNCQNAICRMMFHLRFGSDQNTCLVRYEMIL